jgi:hypothetical protein
MRARALRARAPRRHPSQPGSGYRRSGQHRPGRLRHVLRETVGRGKRRRRRVTGTPNGDAPNILDASFNFKADVDIPQSGAEGMIVTQGGRFGGYGFYVLKGKPVFLYNFLDFKRTRWEAPDALTPGKHTLEFDFKYDGLGAATLAFNNVSGIGRGGTGVLKVACAGWCCATANRSTLFLHPTDRLS